MKFPVEIPIGSTSVPLHAILESMGIFIGFRYFLYLRKKQGDSIEQENRIWILIAAMFGALLGSRLIGSLEDPQRWFDAKSKLLYFYQNKTVLGGFLGGLIAVEGVKKYIGEKQASGDLFVQPLLLALIIGRIGCFSMGIYEETYGISTTFITGINLGDGISRHPVCLYEIVFLISLWIIFTQTKMKATLAQGSIFKLFMICYLLFRFVLDFLKPHYTYSFGLSTIQVTALAGLIYYSPFIFKPSKLYQKYA